MLSLHKRFSCDLWERCCFDPGTLTGLAIAGAVGSGASSLIGGKMSADATIAGGNAALAAGQMQKASFDYQATEDTQNASQAFAAGQRQMLDDQTKTRLALSTARADAAGNGTNAGVGSASTVQGMIAKRGSFNAAMDMFNGESAATGLLNKAAGETYSGQAALIGGQEGQSASEIAANATIAGSIGSAFGAAGSGVKSYGSFAFPNQFKSS